MAWQEYQNESLETLVEYIQLKDDPDFKESSKDAFIALTMLFQEDLLKRLIPICRNWGHDRDYAIELGRRVFERLWKYPTGFTLDKAKSKDPTTAFLLYLFGFAKRLLATDYKASQEKSPWTSDEEVVLDFPDIETLDISVERKALLVKGYEIIKCALDQLSPKHKIIYLTYKQYEEELKGGKQLPRHLLSDLREKLDITQASIRVYKKQAFDKVEEYLKIYGSK